MSRPKPSTPTTETYERQVIWYTEPSADLRFQIVHGYVLPSSIALCGSDRPRRFGTTAKPEGHRYAECRGCVSKLKNRKV
jgi:hypothetical protein